MDGRPTRVDEARTGAYLYLRTYLVPAPWLPRTAVTGNAELPPVCVALCVSSSTV